MNSVQLIGRLGKDPEAREYGSGEVLCRFSLAVDRFAKGKDKETDWLNVTVFGKTAELCLEYLSKGRQVCVEGRIQTRSWEADDGTKRYATDIVANRVHFIGPREDAPAKSAGTHSERNWKDDTDEALPF